MLFVSEEIINNEIIIYIYCFLIKLSIKFIILKFSYKQIEIKKY